MKEYTRPVKGPRNEKWAKLPLKSVSEILVSTEGRVFNNSTGNLIKGKLTTNCHRSIDFKEKGKQNKTTMTIGYAVLLTFTKKPKNATKTIHKDNVLVNNKLSNLAWR